MNILKTPLEGLLLIEPKVFRDQRGFFMESYTRREYLKAGINAEFVQDNHSASVKNVLRGLHFQENHGQAKLVRVIQGEIFDVAVDIRHDSPTYGKWAGYSLSDKNMLQMYVPVGFAHGFCVTSDTAEVLYRCSDYYSPKDERGIIWNDPDLAISWPVENPILSEKDCNYPLLRDLKQYSKL